MPEKQALHEILTGLRSGTIVPYLGPGIREAADAPPAHPADPLALAAKLTEKTGVPHKIRKNLSAAAQYIENFKHRKTLTSLMNAAFAAKATPTALHEFLASLPQLSLVVDAWYDDALQRALAKNPNWGQVQGVSRAEHYGEWVRYYTAHGELADAATANAWKTLLYRPLGSCTPAQNYIVSDSDYVEILTEIDIQTPIPPIVQQRRTGKQFLFLGCRFTNQLDRILARQIMKRSSDRHWAITDSEPTRNEARFLAELNITRVAIPLDDLLGLATTTQI